jgi:hypothetical protein
VLKLKEKHFIDPKRSEILSVFKVFHCMMQIAFLLAKNCSLLFSLRSLEIPALLKSWQKHWIYLALQIKSRGAKNSYQAIFKCKTLRH